MAADEIALYVHWPYCVKVCPYCDFNVYRTRAVDEAAWRAAFARDIEAIAERSGPRRLVSVYFGGGTPSLMAPSLAGDVLDMAAQAWTPGDGMEVTLEANPTDAEGDRFAGFAATGVNRLSLGVQRFDDASLAFLGRNHDTYAARHALDRALTTFDRVSFDLIYGLPGETLADWRRTLETGLAVGADHLSLYQLTVEPGTAFDRAVTRGAWSPIPDDLEAEFYALAQEMTAAAGLAAYEISNHAREGRASRHNLVYWRGGDYAGIGPGAHGRVTVGGQRRASVAERRPDAYLRGAAPLVWETLTADDWFAERLLMGLRLAEGVDLTTEEWAGIEPRTHGLDAGLIDVAPGSPHSRSARVRLALTDRGRPLLNAILRDLIA